VDSVLAALTGFAFGLSLIVVIGAQNAYVLRQGLRREHVIAVVVVCSASDAVLILAGIGGLGAVIDAAPGVLDALRLVGAVFLLGYAAVAARRVLRPQALDPAASPEPAVTLRRATTTVLALTWLNPHVYLDTVLLLGSVARTHDDDRWWFGAGAVLGSVTWFSALGIGARALRPVFARPVAWQVLDGFISVLMVAIATNLLLEL
jgi:L-lysine exporter family protein LysE/ArgO